MRRLQDLAEPSIWGYHYQPLWKRFSSNIGAEITELYISIISKLKAKRERKTGADISVWKSSDDTFKNWFVTKHTWNLTRTKRATNTWYKGVWFTHSTPKYSFILWLAIRNRLTTGDKLRSWNLGLNVVCSICGNAEDTRNHLFFGYRISGDIWQNIASKLLGSDFTTYWDMLISLLTSSRPKYNLFLIRYAFQSTIYHLWRERNRRRHGEAALTTRVLTKQIKKNIKNRINSIWNMEEHAYSEAMDMWFETR